MGLFDSIANSIAQQTSPVVGLASNTLLAGGVPTVQNVLDGPPVQLMGGVSLKRAKQIFDKARHTKYARKNLWYISIANVSPLNLPFEAASSLAGLGQNLAGSFTSGDFFSVDTLATAASMAVPFLNWSNFDFNLFATDVSYSPVQMNHSTVHIGGAAFSNLDGKELVEVRITTLDDERGSIKSWFRKKASLMVMPGGAVGLPITYLLKVRVTHAFIDDEVAGANSAYYDEFVMKPTSIDTDLNRREDGMQELHLTFTQFDNFTKLV
jgi:hypothetical protein